MIESNGLSFNVIDEGEGSPVLLLHGFPDTSAVWREQVPALAAAGFRAIAPDLRGRGASDAPEGVEAYGIGHVVDDLTGIMDALEIERAHIVGHDFGAAAAWVFAIARPERVDRLSVLSVGHPNSRYPLSLSAVRKTFYFFIFNQPFAEELLMRDDWAVFRQWFGGQADPEPFIDDLARPGRLTAGLNWYRANVPPESLMHGPLPFPPVKAPTLAMFGMRDFALTEEAMLRSEQYVEGGWRYERFDDAGHWIQLDEPDRVNKLLIDFPTG